MGYKEKAFLIFAGLVLSTLWGYYTLVPNTGSIHSDIVIICTGLLGTLIRQQTGQNAKDRLYFIAPCLIYFGLFYIMGNIDIYSKLNNPFNIYLIVLLVTLYINMKSVVLLLFLIMGIIIKNELPMYIYNSDVSSKKEEFEVVQDFRGSNITEFTFIKGPDKEIKMQLNNKPWLIETWAEWCSPCIAAIKELPEFFADNGVELNHYYLYADGKFGKLKDKSDVFDYDKIDNKDHIIVSENQEYEDYYGLKPKPTFVFYDAEGNYHSLYVGYRKYEILKIYRELIND